MANLKTGVTRKKTKPNNLKNEHFLSPNTHTRVLPTIYSVESCDINRIQDWGSKRVPTSFSPVTSANVDFSAQSFLTFSFDSFYNTGVKCQGHT